MPKGGKRQGAGKPKSHPTGEKLTRKTYFATQSVHEKIRALIDYDRQQALEAKDLQETQEQ